MNTLIQDIRYGLRTLLKTPGLALAAVATLALGIGANTAIFSVANAVLFQSLQFGEPERIVMVWQTNPRFQQSGDKLPASGADFVDWREQNQTFESMGAFTSFFFNLTGGDIPDKVDGVLCSADFFSVLGVQPSRGRAFIPGEDRQGNNKVVIVSDNFWKQRAASDPELIGKSLTLNAEKYTVIGIMPEGVEFPQGSAMPPYLEFGPRPELWVPLPFDDETSRDRTVLGLAVIARLKRDVSLQQAQADMSGIIGRIDQQFRKSSGFGANVMSLREQVIGDVRLPMLVLLGTAGLVLLIACANVANLLLVRSTARQKEFAIRSALGASRARLIRQMFTESLIIAGIGSILGLLLAKWGTNVLVAISYGNIPRLEEVAIDGWVLGFTLVLSLLAGLISGVIPALQASRIDLNQLLKEESRSATGGVYSRRVRNFLVISEVGLTLTLLIAAGLLVKSFLLLQQVGLGLNQDNVLTMRISLPDFKYAEGYKRSAFFSQLLQRVESLPEVESTGIVTSLPLSGVATSLTLAIEGQVYNSPQERPIVDYVKVSPDYFTAMRTPLLDGRYFSDRDTETSPPVVIINEAMAKRFWPNENPMGKRLAVTSEQNQPLKEVVGIVGDVRSTALAAEPKPTIYVSFYQKPDLLMYLVTRAKGDPMSLATTIRDQVLAVDKDQPVYDIKSMHKVISDSAAQRTFIMFLLSIFAALALIFAMVGIYGVIAYTVSLRRHEIGVRMALGAQRSDIMKLILRHGLALTLIGVAIGLVAAFSLTRVMSSLLFQITATDPITFAIAILVLTIVALLATCIPARRATAVEPMLALRQE